MCPLVLRDSAPVFQTLTQLGVTECQCHGKHQYFTVYSKRVMNLIEYKAIVR